MRFNIRHTGTLLLEEVASRIDTVEMPLILLDMDLKIVAKNRLAAEYILGTRKGSKINRFVSAEDIKSIEQMQPTEVFNTQIIDGIFRSDATVICGIDCRLLVLRPVSVGIRNRLDMLYGKMSGYDTVITEPEFSALPMHSEITEIIFRILNDLNTVRGLPFFNISSVVNGIVKELERILPKYRGRVNASITSDEIISNGSERDFALAAVFLIMFCMNSDPNGQVNIEVGEASGEAEICISSANCRSDFCVKPRTPYEEGDIVDESEFLLHLIRLIAEGNLWDFSVEQASDNGAVFTIRAPFAVPSDDYILRDIVPERIARLVAIVVSAFEESLY